MKDIINPMHGGMNTVEIPDIADIKLQFVIAVSISHVILLLFITAEYTNFFYTGI